MALRKMNSFRLPPPIHSPFFASLSRCLPLPASARLHLLLAQEKEETASAPCWIFALSFQALSLEQALSQPCHPASIPPPAIFNEVRIRDEKAQFSSIFICQPKGNSSSIPANLVLPTSVKCHSTLIARNRWSAI